MRLSDLAELSILLTRERGGDTHSITSVFSHFGLRGEPLQSAAFRGVASIARKDGFASPPRCMR